MPTWVARTDPTLSQPWQSETSAFTIRSMFSIASNVCLADWAVVRYTVPSWLKVFGSSLAEVVVVVDERPPTGRIAESNPDLWDKGKLWHELSLLREHDSRVRIVRLSECPSEAVSRKWFGKSRPVRCQAGTPILAFICALEATHQDWVMRTDSDMLFHEAGWLKAAENLLGQGVVVEPPRLALETQVISTRALMVKRSCFAKCLPIKPWRLHPLGRLHRALKGRPTWLALEQMLEREKIKGRIRHTILPRTLGFSLHVARRQYSIEPWFGTMVKRVETGDIPTEQAAQWNLSPQCWSAATPDLPPTETSARWVPHGL